MKVRSPKSANFGKAIREVPLFPEVRQALGELYLEPDGGEYVIATNDRSSQKNLRTVFEKILRKAGVDPWQRLFQNLRASRETELAQDHAIHLVTAWLGNTPKVAMEHYLQVRDEDFTKAALIGENGLFRRVYRRFDAIASSLIQSQEIAGNRGNSVISWKTGRFFHEMNSLQRPTKTARSSMMAGRVEFVGGVFVNPVGEGAWQRSACQDFDRCARARGGRSHARRLDGPGVGWTGHTNARHTRRSGVTRSGRSRSSMSHTLAIRERAASCVRSPASVSQTINPSPSSFGTREA